MGNDARGNAVVTCFITFGCQIKPVKTKNEREREREDGQGCSGRREIFTPTGG